MATYRKLNRRSDQRKAMLRDLVTQLIIHERLETTEAKAKELSRLFDKMVTLGKKGTLEARRDAARTVRFLDDIADRYKDRQGGYTRTMKLGPRRGDATEMVVIELV